MCIRDRNIDHAVNEAAVLVLANLYFQWCILNVNKIDIVLYFSELICRFLLICVEVCIYKISVKTHIFLWNYSNLFMGPHFICTQCMLCLEDSLQLKSFYSTGFHGGLVWVTVICGIFVEILCICQFMSVCQWNGTGLMSLQWSSLHVMLLVNMCAGVLVLPMMVSCTWHVCSECC